MDIKSENSIFLQAKTSAWLRGNKKAFSKEGCQPQSGEVLSISAKIKTPAYPKNNRNA